MLAPCRAFPFVDRRQALLVCSLLLAGLLTQPLPATAQALPAGDAGLTADRLTPALNTVRERGCAKSREVKRLPAFELNTRLSTAAARVASGLPLAAALKAAGYVAPRSVVLSLSAYPDPQALADGAARYACATLSDPALRELGLHVQGQTVWIVMAEPFTPPKASEAGEVAVQVLALVNAARAQARQCGDKTMAAAPPLRLNALLSQAALAHAQDMARHSYFSHTGRDGSQVGLRATRAGYAWRQIGENLAAGQMQPEAAVDGWLKSPGHCMNLMRPGFTEMGLAFSVNLASDNSIYWVQVLGTPR